MSEVTEIAVVPAKENALSVFTAANGLDPYLAKIREEIEGFTPDTSTKKGRDAIASIAYKVARSKTALDNVGKELVAELKDVPKKIDAERKRVRDILDSWQEEVRRPLNEWQAAEDARVDRHNDGIEWFRIRAEENSDLDAAELNTSIAEVEARIIDESWQEFEAEAHRVKARALVGLKEALEKRVKADNEAAELVRLRQEDESRAEADRIAEAQRVAVEAERQRVEKERREQQEESDRLVRKAELEREQARQDEIDRQQRAADEIDRQRLARESDLNHKIKIMGEAKQAIMGMNVSEELAKAIVLKIASGEVPNITINF